MTDRYLAPLSDLEIQYRLSLVDDVQTAVQELGRHREAVPTPLSEAELLVLMLAVRTLTKIVETK